MHLQRLQLEILDIGFTKLLENTEKNLQKQPSEALVLRKTGITTRKAMLSGYASLITHSLIEPEDEGLIEDLILLARKELEMMLEDPRYAGSDEKYKNF